MALDSAIKRGSAIGVGLPFVNVSVSDSSMATGEDRQAATMMVYAGVLALALVSNIVAVPAWRTLRIFYEGRTRSISSEPRTRNVKTESRTLEV